MDKNEAWQRMQEGRIYLPMDDAIMAAQLQQNELLYDYNQTRPMEQNKRNEILGQLLAEKGENSYIEPPLHANWGNHTHIGDDFYANFNLTLVDDGDIFIENQVMIGPNVVIATAGHPVEPTLRHKGAQFNIPVHIGNNVWIGASTTILPGVTIGDNTVIGAGSVVTKDIPANVVAVGNPCKVLRQIGEHDQIYYFKNRKIDMTIE